MNCATKVRFFLSNFWGAVQKGCFFYRFLVLRLHKKALIPRLFPVDLDAPCMDLVRTFHIENKQNVEYS